MIIEWSSGCARATTGDRDFSLNKKPYLLLHCDGTDESQTFTDSGGTGHTVTAKGTAQIDTAESKWGGASGLFDRNSDYLTIPDHANWDLATNYTIDLWIKHTNYNGSQIYLMHYEAGSGNGYWQLRYLDGSGIQFSVYKIDTGTIVDTGTGGTMDYDWHHVAMCKVGNEYGVYKDGTQVSHTSDADTNDTAGNLYIGADYTPGNYFGGYMDEIRIVPFNVFNAAPVVGLTDTIIVPIRPYMSWS